jgi:acyl-CoA dehydrogenase
MAEWRLQNLPFFDEGHFRLADKLQEWRGREGIPPEAHGSEVPQSLCRELLRQLAQWGFLDYVVPEPAHSATTRLDVRSICIIREALAFDSCLTDTMFVMQGLGTSPLWRHPDAEVRRRYLDPARRGETISALALTEPDAGSDVAAITTSATRHGGSYVLNGHKAWISNGGMADHYLVIARTGEAPGSRGLSAFMVEAGTPGLAWGPQEEMIAPHPISMLSFTDCRVPASSMIGEAGQGFKAVMAGFDVFRPSVGAAAVGVARRALAEAVARVKSRRMFGKPMAEMDNVQAKIADMAVDTEAASLMVYRAAWMADTLGGRVSAQAAMGKLLATESAQRVVDSAVQLFGAAGVWRGSIVEKLYRDIRPMRIYEGASEVQKVVIARSVLADDVR